MQCNSWGRRLLTGACSNATSQSGHTPIHTRAPTPTDPILTGTTASSPQLHSCRPHRSVQQQTNSVWGWMLPASDMHGVHQASHLKTRDLLIPKQELIQELLAQAFVLLLRGRGQQGRLPASTPAPAAASAHCLSLQPLQPPSIYCMVHVWLCVSHTTTSDTRPDIMAWT